MPPRVLWISKWLWLAIELIALVVAFLAGLGAVASTFTSEKPKPTDSAEPAVEPVKQTHFPPGLACTITVTASVFAAGFARWAVKRCDDVEKKEQGDWRVWYTGQSRRMIQGVLTHMRDHFFENVEGIAQDNHRVTLFHFNSDAMHLEIYARVGIYQESVTRWAVDRNDREKCRGFAGKVWFDDITLIDASEHPWPTDDDPVKKAAYAKSQSLTLEEAEGLNLKASVLAGVPVMVNGRKWGVLFVDSTVDWRSHHKASFGKQKKRLERYAVLLSQVLAEVEG